MDGDSIDVVVVDAETLAGWRRSTPCLQQLFAAVSDLESTFPEAAVAVVADPSLKWALSGPERAMLSEAIVNGEIVLSPAGAVQGHKGFLRQVLRKCAEQGLRAVLLTDQAIEEARLVRVSKRGSRWVFDISERRNRADSRRAAAAAETPLSRDRTSRRSAH
jgi:hypothetical protein